MIERGESILTVAPGGATALDVSRATVIYRNGHLALKQATFTIPRGVIAGLVGVNGSGKSTLFKSIMGFITLASGEISVMGHPPAKALKRHLVSYAPQSEEVDWNFPVLAEDVVMMGRYGHMGMMRIARQTDRDAVACALERVGMSGLRKRQIGELSGGQRKRFFLARAIAQDGQLILLDGPFTGVDLKTEKQIVTLLRSLRDEGRTILVSTHNLGSVPTFCDMTVLVKGTVMACGPTREIFTRSNIERAFDGALHQLAWDDNLLTPEAR